jgi:Xaa-Pro aminopeptidase
MSNRPHQPIRRSGLPCAVALLAALAGCTGQQPAAGTHVEYLEDVPGVPMSEYAARRDVALAALSDGILVLHARPAEKAMEQWGFVQDPTFQYYSGLLEVPGAILALDGRNGTSHLFLPPAPMSFGMAVEGLVPPPGAETATTYGMDSARPWGDFVPWLEGRLRAEGVVVYLDEPRRPESTGAPEGTPPLAGDRALWRAWISSTFPSAGLASAKAAIVEQRSVKSDVEIRILARNARTTAVSLLAVAGRLVPGVHHRETEAAMLSACLAAGGQGPAFWPWTMSGPTAHMGALVGAFFRYDQGDRVAQAGELMRVDIGCAGGNYGADVGRTLPVSGSFAEGQAEAWNLLIAGYLAGLDAMGDGVTVADVRSASVAAVQGRADEMTTADGRAAAAAILSGGDGVWHIHGVGVEGGEDILPVLRSGMVVAYEPGFVVGEDAYYLEDMILVTDGGHRVLSAGLPYTAEEIERVMER